MSEPIYLTETKDCKPGSSLELVVAGRVIALFNINGEFFALDGVCPHQGGPLGKGKLEGHLVTCPWHGWQFDVKSGKCLISAAIQQPRLELKVDQGQIFLLVGS